MSHADSRQRSERGERTPRRRLRLAVTLLALVAGPLIAEGWMRFLLFHPSEAAQRWGAELRDAGNFANPKVEDEYWRLMSELNRERMGDEPAAFDPLLGWVSRYVEPYSYAFKAPPELAGRRPVLLYGASYAQGVLNVEPRFEGLLQASSLADELVMLNFGVGGYGVDQTYLLLRESIDAHVEHRPLVVIGLVADSDFERCSMGFRTWPKPRLRLIDGELREDPPLKTGAPRAYLAKYGTGIRSYVWRYVLGTLDPTRYQDTMASDSSMREAQRELIRAILGALRDELEARELEYFVMLFVSPQALRTSERCCHELFLEDLMESEGIPYVRTRDYIEPTLGENRQPGISELYYRNGPAKNHPNPRGNELLFEAMCDGFDGRYALVE